MAVMQRIWKPLRPCSPMAVLSFTVLRLEQQSKLKPQESRKEYYTNSSRFMPPSMPIAGMPRIALVFARPMIEGDDRGIRPFIVGLGDGKEMCTGVTTT